MTKYLVTVQPKEGASVSYTVGGFDSRDALTQGKYRWVGSDDMKRSLDDIEYASAYQIEETVPA